MLAFSLYAYLGFTVQITLFPLPEVKSPGKMMPMNTKRDSLLNMRPFRRGRYLDKVRCFLHLFNSDVFISSIVIHFPEDEYE